MTDSVMSLPFKLCVWVLGLRRVSHVFKKVLFIFWDHISKPLQGVQIWWTQVHKYCTTKHISFKFTWTKKFSKATGKELTIDNLFAFEKCSNEPVKYLQELWGKTADAIKIIRDQGNLKWKGWRKWRTTEGSENQRSEAKHS